MNSSPRDTIVTLCRLADRSLRDLAAELGLHPGVLSRKLSTRSDAQLSIPERKRLLRILSTWGCLSEPGDVAALIAALELTPNTFSAAEWQEPPLALLNQPAAPAPERPITAMLRSQAALPAPLTRLIGRSSELSRLSELFRQPHMRLITLIGPGGSGKTRLAIAAAEQIAAQLHSEVGFVDLSSLSDPQEVLPLIAWSLGSTEQQRATMHEALAAMLHQRPMLLVLDNLEQVLGAAPQIGALLAAAPELRILATSRAPLRIYGEWEFAVPPLKLPNGAAANMRGLARVPAVQLFIERARAVQSDLELNAETAAAISTICIKLDGLPLAIELAAARSRLLDPPTLLEHLNRHWNAVLADGPRDRPGRQRTLWNTLEWSFQLLDTEQQQVFTALGACAGNLNPALVGAISATTRPNILDELVDRSLVQRAAGERPAERHYYLLATIHEYARRRLAMSAQSEQVHRRHAEHMLMLAEQAAPLLHGPEQVVWLDRLEHAHDNMRAALQWAISHNEAELSLRLAAALGEFWWPRGHLHEGRTWLERALALTGGSAHSRAVALYRAGDLAYGHGNTASAIRLLEQSLQLFRSLNDRWGIPRVLRSLASTHALIGEHERADILRHEALDYFRADNDRWGLSWMLLHLAEHTADPTRRRELLESSLQYSHADGFKRITLYTLLRLAILDRIAGATQQAMLRCYQAIELAQELGDRWITAWAELDLAMIRIDQRDHPAATRLAEGSLKQFRAVGNLIGEATALRILGEAAVLAGDHERAQALFTASYQGYYRSNDQNGQLLTLHARANLALRMKQYAAAAAILHDTIARYPSINGAIQAAMLVTIVELALATGHAESAGQLWPYVETVIAAAETSIAESDQRRYRSIAAAVPSGQPPNPADADILIATILNDLRPN